VSGADKGAIGFLVEESIARANEIACLCLQLAESIASEQERTAVGGIGRLAFSLSESLSDLLDAVLERRSERCS
jgi:predicted urease superfamily metal-dependent hydrolase